MKNETIKELSNFYSTMLYILYLNQCKRNRNVNIMIMEILIMITLMIIIIRTISSSSNINSNRIIRSSRMQMFFKIDALKKLAICMEEHLRWCLFSMNLQNCRPSTLLKRDSKQLFSCEYCETFKSSFFIEHLRWLPLNHYLQYQKYSSIQKISFQFLYSPYLINFIKFI